MVLKKLFSYLVMKIFLDETKLAIHRRVFTISETNLTKRSLDDTLKPVS